MLFTLFELWPVLLVDAAVLILNAGLGQDEPADLGAAGAVKVDERELGHPDVD